MDVAQPVQPVPERGRRATRILLIVATVLYGLSLVPAAFMVMMSPMIFDAGPSPEAWTMFSFVVGYPVLVLVTIVAGWVLFALKKYRAALIVSLLPVLEIVAGAVVMML